MVAWVDAAASGVSSSFASAKNAVWGETVEEKKGWGSGISSTFGAVKKSVWGVNVEENLGIGTGISNGFGAVKKSVWESSLEEKKGFSNGISNGFGAVKKTVWGESQEEKKGVGAAVAAGVKNATVGVFRQINTVGEPIFKHISGPTAGWRPINEAGKGAIYKPASTNGVLSSLGWATFYGAAGFDLFRFGHAAKKDYDEGGNYDKSTVMGASIAGAWAGAINGGALGASALSVVPGVGTVVGGVAGGVIGAVYGAKGGEAVAKALLPEENRKSWMETIKSKL